MKKQLGLLVLCNVLIFSAANGLLPLLPIYATELGASAAVVGGYMGFAYAVLAAGTLMTARLIRQFRSTKRLFVIMTVTAMFAVVLMGQIAALWQLVLLTAIVWFCGGIAVALIYVFTGMLANEANRGKTFGILFLGQPIGALVGGSIIGRLADNQGYAFLFAVLGIIWLVVALLGLFGLADREVASSTNTSQHASQSKTRVSRSFNLLLAAVLLVAIASFIGRLGTSLTMSSHDFPAGAITETTAVGGLFVIPVVLSLSILSDRIGRRGLLSLCYMLGAAGLLVLSGASALWHFWIVAIFISMANYAGSSVASALAADLLPPDALGTGLPRLNAMNWIGGIVGFSSAGFLGELIGPESLYIGSTIIAVTSVSLLWLQFILPATKHTPEQTQINAPTSSATIS